MSEPDITERLRAWSYFIDEVSPDLREGADEIDRLRAEVERLRRNTGCARDQRATQFCHEALDAQRDVETLRAELVKNADEFGETLTAHRSTIECLTAERDHAVREAAEARQVIFRLQTNAACCRSSPDATTRDGEEPFISEAL
jgi:cell division septum initiation protein DivIVA